MKKSPGTAIPSDESLIYSTRAIRDSSATRKKINVQKMK
jgi:hypothetical protein